MPPFAEYLSQWASFIGSLTVVGGALLWVYHKFIGNPREKRKLEEEKRKELRRAKEDEERYKKVLDLVTNENKPLVDSIEKLNDWLQESAEDRKQLNTITKQHTELIKSNSKLISLNDKRLDRHGDRILILEVRSGLKSTDALKGVQDEEMDFD